MTQLDTTLTAVAVYPDRARVTRRGSVTLESGSYSLEISDLPVKINPDSFRATARGTARARLLGVQVQRTFYSEIPEGHVRELESQVEDLEDKISGLDAQAALVKQNRTTLDALAGQTETYAIALAAGEMGVEAQLALFDNLRARAEKLDAEQLNIAIRKRETERRLEKLRGELNQHRSARPRRRYTAIVDVEVFQGGELTVELSYMLSAAGWKPLYDLRLLEDEGKPSLEVGYLAQVTQQTGETWEEVAMTLSTARPALAGVVPELDPWYVRPVPPPRPVRMAQAMAPQPAPVSLAMGDVAEPQAEQTVVAVPAPETQAEVAVATVDASGAAVTYRVSGAVTVPPDGAPHKVTVANFSLSPKLDYVTAPKLVEAAYRRATVSNDSPYILLPGAANLFAGDEFIGTTQLELTPPQGEIELYLGADDRIKVERELKRRDVDKRFIGGKRRHSYGYEITLENLLPTEAKVTLHDQVPVPRHEDIKVKLESAEPKPTERTELNLLEWELTLASNEERVVRFDFTVESPQAMELLGLP